MKKNNSFKEKCSGSLHRVAAVSLALLVWGSALLPTASTAAAVVPTVAAVAVVTGSVALVAGGGACTSYTADIQGPKKCDPGQVLTYCIWYTSLRGDECGEPQRGYGCGANVTEGQQAVQRDFGKGKFFLPDCANTHSSTRQAAEVEVSKFETQHAEKKQPQTEGSTGGISVGSGEPLPTSGGGTTGNEPCPAEE